jgi:hypothetical protein
MSLDSLPIQFYRVAPGEYLSTSVAVPWVAEYRIYRTEHAGRGVTHNGRTRWHVIHVPIGRSIGHRFAGSNNYSLSLEEAIRTLHLAIGRMLRDAFEVLSKMNADAERAVRIQAEYAAARAALESKIFDAINRHGPPVVLTEDQARALARAIAEGLK